VLLLEPRQLLLQLAFFLFCQLPPLVLGSCSRPRLRPGPTIYTGKLS
jgi:hypothetical protein